MHGIPFARSARPGKMHKENPARGLFDDYKPVLNVDLRAVDLGQHADLDGRDYMALFGLPPDGTSAEVDIAFNKLRHDWSVESVAERYPGRQPKELRKLEATYLEMEQLLKKAYTLLSYGSVRNAYRTHLLQRDEILEAELDDWMLELDNVHPVPCSRCFPHLQGCYMRMLDSVVVQDGVLQQWWFTDKKGVIRCKKGPLKPSHIMSVFNEQAKGAEEKQDSKECAILMRMKVKANGPMGALDVVPCTVKEARSALEGQDPLCVAVQDDIGTAITYRCMYMLQDLEHAETTAEMAEGSKGLDTDFYDITGNIRYDKVCSNLGALVRYMVFHIEQTQGLRVLKTKVEFVTDINGLFFFKRVVLMFMASLQPWLPPSYQPTEKLNISRREFETSDAWFPDSPGGTFSEEQLRQSWPGIGGAATMPLPRRSRSCAIGAKSTFDIEPAWQNQFARTVRLRPKEAMVGNFRGPRRSKSQAKFPSKLPPAASARELQEAISLNAQIIRHPFMPLQTSCSVPGRHLKAPMLSLVKPWEYTARPTRSVLWTAQLPRKIREPEDPYGLELRNLSKQTGFDLEQCYEMYARMGTFADTFQGFRDRDITRSNPCNFIEDEWEAFLRRCGIRKRMVARRMFHAFMHPVGFGRKKRRLLAFKDAVFGLCAFGMGRHRAQAEALFRVIDQSGDGSVTRAELLAFMTVMLPDGLELPKIETFKRVSGIFEVLDSDGGGELEANEFVQGVCENQDVYDRLQDMSPFQRYFTKWNHTDMSLQNIFTALDQPVVVAADDPLVMMLEMLTKRCRAVYEQIKELPSEEEDHPDLQGPFVGIKVALNMLLEIGVRPEWANQEIENIKHRPDGNLNGDDFVKLLVGTAEMNPQGFEALEGRFKKESDQEKAKQISGHGRVKVDVSRATMAY